MKRVLGVLAIASCVSLGFALPAGAGGGPPAFTYAPLVPGSNVLQACQNSGNVVTFGIGGEIFGELDTGSLGACVTTVRSNQLSTLAYYNNCRALEPEFAATNPSGRPYPYSFYGNPAYTARNISGCIYFLRAFHTGQLPPGPGGGA